MANNMRLSGINTGYDTEAMITQMMSAYQTKIDKENQKLTKLTWQQEAYRDIIDKLKGFQSKYFDILKKDSYLLSPNTFNRFNSEVTNKATGEKMSGLSVTTTSSSAAGTYKLQVTQLAESAKIKGGSAMNAGFKLDLKKAFENSSYTENADGTRNYKFALDVKVGDVSKTIEFDTDVTAEMLDGGNIDTDKFYEKVTENLNGALLDAFGDIGADRDGVAGNDPFLQVKLNGDSLEFVPGGNSTVTVTEKTGNFGLAKMAKSQSVSMMSAVTGKNTIALDIPGKGVVNVSFDGVSDTYFDSRKESGNEAINAEYESLKLKAYMKENNIYSASQVDQAKLKDFSYSSAQAAKDKNTEELNKALAASSELRSAGVSVSVKDGVISAKKGEAAIEFAVTSVEGGTLGIAKGSSANRFTGKTKLKDMGITGNGILVDAATGEQEREYTFKINGKDITVGPDATINDLIDAVNKSDAGVEMSYSNLTNSFELTSKNMGSSERIQLEEGNRILSELGLSQDNFVAGKNAVFKLNDVEIFHNSNSYTVEGTTFRFSDDMDVGESATTYNISITKSYDDVKQTIKDFVADYNQLIEDVYGHIGTTPQRDNKNNKYEPLTDAQKEEMTEEQIKKWEEAAKKGVIYNDSTVSSIMSQIRTALYNSVTLDDGTTFGLYNMGIRTVNLNESQHGKLEIDEEKLDAAFNNHADAIEKLFTDPEKSVMKRINNVIDSAISTSKGTNGYIKGSLIRKAGLKSGATNKNNTIYKEMERVQKRISQLQDRYDAKEDYWWKVFTNLEKMTGQLNSQMSYMSGLLTNYGNNGNNSSY